MPPKQVSLFSTIFGFLEQFSTMQRNNIIRVLIVLSILALAYYGYDILISTSSQKLTFVADSVVFKRGCYHPDSACFRVKYRFPVPVGRGSSRIEKLIVTDYLEMVSERTQKTDISSFKNLLVQNIMGYDSSYVEYYNYFGGGTEWYIDVDYKVKFRTKRLISIGYEHNSYLGGAHGLYGYFYLNIDLKKGKALQLNDLFTDTDKFKAIFYKYFMGKLMNESDSSADILMTQEPELPHEFCLVPEGIMLHYNVYEIASYARGDITLLIPYHEVSSILRGYYANELIGTNR